MLWPGLQGPTKEVQPGNKEASPSVERKRQLSRARHLKAERLRSEQRKTKGLEIGSGGNEDKGSGGGRN